MSDKLEWKNESPTEDGFYWQNEHGKISLVAVTVSHEYGKILTFGNPTEISIPELVEHGIEWCGPVAVTAYPPLRADAPVFYDTLPYYGGTYVN